MQATYELFLSRVAEGRKSTREKIDAVAQGRVWTGRQALERGLVDELGGLDRAIRLAKERAKLDVSKDVELLDVSAEAVDLRHLRQLVRRSLRGPRCPRPASCAGS